MWDLKGALLVPYFLVSTCRRRGRMRRIGLMWRSPLGRGGWELMQMVDCVWAARSRLPLPTSFYWPEAAHLGDLLRLWVRPEAGVYTRPPDFQGPASATPDPAPDTALYWAAVPISNPVGFRQINPPITKKRQLFPGLQPASSGSIASQLWPPRGGELRLKVREY